MEYLLIIALQLLGIGFNVLQVLIRLDTKYVDDTFKDVWIAFWKEDKFTLILSGLILLTDLTAHFILTYYNNQLIKWEYFTVVSLGTAFILGYAGQRLVYKWLGSAEKFLDKKITDKLQ